MWNRGMRLNDRQAKLILTDDAYETYEQTDYEIYFEDMGLESNKPTFTVTDYGGRVILTNKGIDKVNYFFENFDDYL